MTALPGLRQRRVRQRPLQRRRRRPRDPSTAAGSRDGCADDVGDLLYEPPRAAATAFDRGLPPASRGSCSAVNPASAGPAALANLGHPRMLATGYLAAEGRPLPHYWTGAWWTLATLALYLGAAGLYAAGFTDGTYAAGATTPLTSSFLGATIQADTTGGGWTIQGNQLLVVVLLLTVVYLVASRAWRALPPLRQRLTAR